MAHQSQLLRYHIRIWYRNGNTEDAVLHALHHRYTYQPEDIYLLSRGLLIHLCSCYLHNVRNTMMNLPTEAWYWSHVLQAYHSKDMWYLPTP